MWVFIRRQNEGVVRFIDNGVDRTEEAYKINNIEIVPEEENDDLVIPAVSLPLPRAPLEPGKEDDEEFDREEVDQVQSRLWTAVFSPFLVFINRERKEDIFSEAFRSILDSITPSILTGFDSSTIQLLLEICYSYLADKEIQHQ